MTMMRTSIEDLKTLLSYRYIHIQIHLNTCIYKKYIYIYQYMTTMMWKDTANFDDGDQFRFPFGGWESVLSALLLALYSNRDHSWLVYIFFWVVQSITCSFIGLMGLSYSEKFSVFSNPSIKFKSLCYKNTV